MKKVRLAFYTEDDLQFLHELLSDPETTKFFPIMYTTNIEQSHLRLKTRLMDQEYGYVNRFLIKELLTGKSVGEISGRNATDAPSTMELAILIHPKYRGKGFAKAGIIEFMKYIIKHKKDINRFRLEIADNNTASIAVARKLEFDFLKEKNGNMQYWEKDADNIK